jgi:hypothetical protein
MLRRKKREGKTKTHRGSGSSVLTTSTNGSSAPSLRSCTTTPLSTSSSPSVRCDLRPVDRRIGSLTTRQAEGEEEPLRGW